MLRQCICARILTVFRAALELKVENNAVTYKYELPELPGTLVTRAGSEDPCYSVSKADRISKNLYALYTDISRYSYVNKTSYWGI